MDEFSSWADWIDKAEPLAFGVLGLSPFEFDELTPNEFAKKIRGFMWLREKEIKDTAWALAQVINTCGNLKKGHTMKMHQLYHPSNMDPANPYYRMIIGK